MKRLVMICLVAFGLALSGCEMLGLGGSGGGQEKGGTGGGGAAKMDMAKTMKDSTKAPHKVPTWDGMKAGQRATWDGPGGTKMMMGVASDSVIEYSVTPDVWVRVEFVESGKSKKAWIYTKGGDKAYEIAIAEPMKSGGGEGGESDWKVVKDESSDVTKEIGGTKFSAVKRHTKMENKKNGKTMESTVVYSAEFPAHPQGGWTMTKDQKMVGVIENQAYKASDYGTDYESTFPKEKKEEKKEE